MALLALAKKLRTQADTGGAPAAATVGTITEIATYPQLRYAEVEGIGTVTIDAIGNMAGYSPVFQCQDSVGELAWLPIHLVRNLRLQAFPVQRAAASAPATAARARTPKKAAAQKPAA